MDIKTSNWFTAMPEGHMKIGISRGIPCGRVAGYRVFRTLAPGPWFHSVEPVKYDRLYKAEILDRLDPKVVATQLIDLARGGVPVMVCYERIGKDQWCHRAMAAEWLAEGLGRLIPELEFEDLPQIDHPLMPPELRRPLRRPTREIPDLTPFVGREAIVESELHKVVSVDPKDARRAIITAAGRVFPAGIDTLRRHFSG